MARGGGGIVDDDRVLRAAAGATDVPARWCTQQGRTIGGKSIKRADQFKGGPRTVRNVLRLVRNGIRSNPAEFTRPDLATVYRDAT